METLSSPSPREDDHHLLLLIGQATKYSTSSNTRTGTTTTTRVPAMKKKKKLNIMDNDKEFLPSGLHGVIVASLLHHLRRRRRLHHGHVFPLLSALSACLLLLFAASSLPIIHHPNHHHHHRNRAYSSNAVEGGSESDSDSGMSFTVPASGGSLGRDLWASKLSKFYYGCSNASDKFATGDAKTHRNRYLVIATSGGLNQQRTGITDAVVAAYILNATLVVPKLDQKSFWKDTSNFSEIFDADHFISFLSKDVKIIKELPTKEGKAVTPTRMRVPRKCTPKCYENRVLPVLMKKHVVQLSKFDYRLSNKLDADLQKLRCRVNYHALKFTDSIREMGEKLVHRMRMKSNHFIALHLR